MKTGIGSHFPISEVSAPTDANPMASATGIPFEDRLAGIVHCSVEVTACMAIAGLFVMILTLKFAAIFFIALLAMLFGRR